MPTSNVRVYVCIYVRTDMARARTSYMTRQRHSRRGVPLGEFVFVFFFFIINIINIIIIINIICIYL